MLHKLGLYVIYKQVKTMSTQKSTENVVSQHKLNLSTNKRKRSNNLKSNKPIKMINPEPIN